jgi:hypothetical protein
MAPDFSTMPCTPSLSTTGPRAPILKPEPMGVMVPLPSMEMR